MFAVVLQEIKEGKHKEEVGMNYTLKVVDVKVILSTNILSAFFNASEKNSFKIKVGRAKDL